MVEVARSLNQGVLMETTAEQIAVECIHRRLLVLLLATRRPGVILQRVPLLSPNLTTRIIDHPVLEGRPWIRWRRHINGGRVSCVVHDQMLMMGRMRSVMLRLGLRRLLRIFRHRKTNLITMTHDSRGRITPCGRWTFIIASAVRRCPRAALVS